MARLWPAGRARGQRPPPLQRACCGATYLGLMLVVALLGLTLAAAGALWSTTQQREREAELLFVGQQYRDGITRFYEHTPAGQQPRFPRSLEELLDDRRWPTPQRQLRKLFADPVTGRAEWGLVRAPDGGVMGVHSLSGAVPYKRAHFPAALAGFGQASSYRAWVFLYGSGAVGAAPPSG